ncbi:MAG TPA: PKD domain-containing protein [Chitinophagaceae bacterium]|nr:PKD domain-containing protein [Chitinophagaceae bacterium]
MKSLIPVLFFLAAIPVSFNASAQQYDLNGDAVKNTCNCYTLTYPSTFQGGSAWNKTKFDLNNPFDFRFSVYLGCADQTGADGMVFMLQQVSTSLGVSGGGLGFDGVKPSIGVTLDTWQNTENNDPPYDHISIQANGVISHGTDLAGPIQASSSGDNIEDCAWHTFRISWDPTTHYLRGYFDGSMRVEAQVDLVATIFNNSPLVYWGFTASTGGSYNLQQFCTALSPGFTTNSNNNAVCLGQPITFTNTSESFAPILGYYWNFGDGSTSTQMNPPPHQYAAPGLYTAQMVVTGFDGCVSDTLKRTIVVGDIPVASFQVFDTCAGLPPRIVDLSTSNVGIITDRSWSVDGNFVSTDLLPQLTNLSAGPHTLQLAVGTSYGCAGTLTASNPVVIKPAPAVEAKALDGCQDKPILFSGTQLDNSTSIATWTWQFGDAKISTGQNPSHTYNKPGSYSVTLTAGADNGCSSPPSVIPLKIVQALAFAGNDTVIIKDQPFQLHATGGGSYSWIPSTGMNDPSVADPTVVLQDDVTYTLLVTTPEGCTDEDDITLTVFKGSSIYVPSGFTPNNDGLNDALVPYYIGIKKVDYYMVYNRWGQLLFSSADPKRAWDGTFKGTQQASGVYVWRLRATDYIGKVYELKGTTTLIR